MPLRTPSALGDNIDLLGRILGETIAAREGMAFFDKVESLRKLAKAARRGSQGRDKLHARMAAILMRAPGAEQYKLAKAYTEFMQLVNVAEQTHRIRRRRFHRTTGNTAQKASPDDVFARLLKAGVAPAKIKRALADMSIELVITAHPTEVMQPETIRAYRDLSAHLLTLDNPTLAAEEREQVTDGIRAIILGQWEASALRKERPTPQDEARYGIELTEKILWKAVPLFFRQMRAAYRRKIGSMADLFPCPIRFASWMGGDRDGHPGVTAAVTRDVLDMSIAAARRLYAHETDLLTRKLTWLPEDADDTRLQKRLQKHLAVLGATARTGTSRDVFMRQLENLKSLLQEHNLLPMVEKELQNLIWRLRVFGLGLLRLDIRQASDVHARAVASLLPGYETLDEEGKIKRLEAALKKSRITLPKRLPVGTREVLATCRLLEEYPAELFGNYIISMAAQASDLLAVQFLMKAAGVTRKTPICPLFETPDALSGAAKVMARAYTISSYRRHTGTRQEIMVGYSDSGKRGGYICALWDIYLLQEDLTRLGRRHGLETVFFHGRGGALARGGGPIESTLDMMPHPQASPRIRITEQGEIINAKFGMPGIAGRTMERYLSGMMDALFARKAAVPKRWREVMERLAATSAANFRDTVYYDANFMAHFQEFTPAAELGLIKIGSRPGTRKKGGGLESMRAIPWIFSWTQPRLMLPAWAGAAGALVQEIKNGNDATLRAMYRGWPFFRAIVDMMEMSVSLADADTVRYYSKLLVEPKLQAKTKQYLAELEAARHFLLHVKERKELLADNPVLRRAIAVRTPYVDVLNILQANLLREYRRGSKRHPHLKSTLALTFSGIAAGMHNTG